MKQRPILFSTDMVKAILEGRKTQTRRIIKDTGLYAIDERYHGEIVAQRERRRLADAKCPYGKAGDVLWVRETFRKVQNYGVDYPIYQFKDEQFSERWCNGKSREIFIEQSVFGKWKPSIHMPKAAARIWLEISNVRVERLQEISEGDAKAEGWTKEPERGNDPDMHRDASKDWFMDLWQSINGPESWEANPWVWCVSFKRVNKPL